MHRDNRITVHFNNPICSFSPRICTAESKYHCTPIQALDWNEWKKQAYSRANHCSYLGLELTPNEIEYREMNIKKANDCNYLMR